MRIYVASSWRNSRQPLVVSKLRAAGHEVYNFRHPEPGNDGFHWSEIDPSWQGWDGVQFAQALAHPIAETGYGRDKAGLDRCDACVLVLPSGRSAHLEAGYAIGQGKSTAILLDDQQEPELMYKLAATLVHSIDGLIGWLGVVAPVKTERGGSMVPNRFRRVDPAALMGKSYRRLHPDNNALISVVAVSPDHPKTHVVVECEGKRWEVEANAVQAALEGQGDGQEINARPAVLAADAFSVTVTMGRLHAEHLREVLLFMDNELTNQSFPDWEDRGILAGLMDTTNDLLVELNRAVDGPTPPAA